MILGRKKNPYNYSVSFFVSTRETKIVLHPSLLLHRQITTVLGLERRTRSQLHFSNILHNPTLKQSPNLELALYYQICPTIALSVCNDTLMDTKNALMEKNNTLMDTKWLSRQKFYYFKGQRSRLFSPSQNCDTIPPK